MLSHWTKLIVGLADLSLCTSYFQVQVQVELYCHSAACGDIQWNEMSCLTGPRCYINTDIQHYKPIHQLTYWQIWLGILYINVYPIQLKIKIKNTNYTNYANASHKYCTCAERNIVSQAAGWGTVQDDL